MNIFMSFKMALQSIASSKIRSTLTMLGIIIGVLAVIVMVNIVNASLLGMRQWMSTMAQNLLEVNIYRESQTTRFVTVKDMEKLAEDHPDVIKAVSPMSGSDASLKCADRNINCRVFGTNETYAEIMGRKLDEGHFFTKTDVINRESAIVIGQWVRQQLFGSRNPVGQTIKINGEVFTVVGLLEQAEDTLTEYGEDSKVFIPYTKAMRLFKFSEIQSYSVSAVDSESAPKAEKIIKDMLFNVFQTEEYWVYNQASQMQEMNEQMNSMTMMAGAIAGISLLVGGIGIMNIMLVTVTERTKEIGIRKAVGARTGSILSQFLIESAMLSCIGGLIGIGGGIVLSEFATAKMQLPSVPMADQMPIIMISFCFSAVVGIFFGFYPAFKAARMNPVDALRYE